MALILRDTLSDDGTSRILDNVIYLAPFNDPPVFTNGNSISVIQNQSAQLQLTATDPESDTLTFSVVGSWPAWATLAGDTITVAPDITVAHGSYAIVARVSDAENSVDQTITVSVACADVLIIAPFKRAVIWDELQTPDLIIGDTFLHTVTLVSGSCGDSYDLSAADSVRVALVSATHERLYSSVVELLSSDIGADWDNGVVTVLIPESVTQEAEGAIKGVSLAKLEIEVRLLGNSFTWFAPVRVVSGFVG